MSQAKRRKTTFTTTPIDASRVESLLRKLRANVSLDAIELSDVANIVESWAHLSERAQRFDLSLADLRRMLGVLARPREHGDADQGSSAIAGERESSDDDAGTMTGPSSPLAGERDEDGAARARADANAQERPTEGSKNAEAIGKVAPARDAHGRRGDNAFADLPCLQHKHCELAAGCLCPTCERGRLYRFFARTFVTIAGQAPFVGHRHEVERLQCNVCGEIYEAPLPKNLVDDGVGNGMLYTYSARTTVVLMKYLGVMPWHRQQTLQAAMGVMVPDASMWDMCEALSTIARPVVSALKHLASASPLFYGDDTMAAVLGLEAQIKTNRRTGKEVKRTGCHTTAVIARLADGRFVAVFRIGIQHTGELLDEILCERPAGLPPPLVAGDASSSNGVTVCPVHLCGCNAHALRRFKALEAKHSEELGGILLAYRTIYKHDAYTKAEAMDEKKRLAYHREHSRPLFQQMCREAQALFDNWKVEPNSTLGSHLNYLLNHQRALSAFFRLPGAPLDNNFVERELRLPVRMRDAAPLFRTEVGASVAAELWTLLVTTVMAGVNAFDYLNALQRHADKVRANPNAWLPWNYEHAAAYHFAAEADRV